jgi:hypothetical protein
MTVSFKSCRCFNIFWYFQFLSGWLCPCFNTRYCFNILLWFNTLHCSNIFWCFQFLPESLCLCFNTRHCFNIWFWFNILPCFKMFWCFQNVLLLQHNSRLPPVKPHYFSSHGATAPREPASHYRGFTITLRHTTLSRIPLDDWSARQGYLYLSTHNTHKRQTSVLLAGFETAILASEGPQTHALDSAATGMQSPSYLPYFQSGLRLVYCCIETKRAFRCKKTNKCSRMSLLYS